MKKTEDMRKKKKKDIWLCQICEKGEMNGLGRKERGISLEGTRAGRYVKGEV